MPDTYTTWDALRDLEQVKMMCENAPRSLGYEFTRECDRIAFYIKQRDERLCLMLDERDELRARLAQAETVCEAAEHVSVYVAPLDGAELLNALSAWQEAKK